MSYIEVINDETVKFIQKSAELILQFRDFDRNIYQLQGAADVLSQENQKAKVDSNFALINQTFFGIIRNHTQGLQSWIFPDEKELAIEILGVNRQDQNQQQTKIEEWNFIFRHLSESEELSSVITRVINPQQFALNLNILMRSVLTLLVSTPVFKSRKELKISRRVHFARETVNNYSIDSNAIPSIRLAKFQKKIYLLHHVFEFNLSYLTDQPDIQDIPVQKNASSSDNFSHSFSPFSLSSNLQYPKNSDEEAKSNLSPISTQNQHQQTNLPSKINEYIQQPPHMSQFSIYSQIDSSFSPSIKKEGYKSGFYLQDKKNNLIEPQQIEESNIQILNLPSQYIHPNQTFSSSNATNNQNSILQIDFSSISIPKSPSKQNSKVSSQIQETSQDLTLPYQSSSPSNYCQRAPKKYSEDLTTLRKNLKNSGTSSSFDDDQEKEEQKGENDQSEGTNIYINDNDQSSIQPLNFERNRASTMIVAQNKKTKIEENELKHVFSPKESMKDSVEQILSQLQEIGDPYSNTKNNVMKDMFDFVLK